MYPTYYKTQINILVLWLFLGSTFEDVFFIVSQEQNKYKIRVGSTIKSCLWHFKVYFSDQNRQKHLQSIVATKIYT